MLNKKRQGFTLMEIVLVMVLIAILATGVAIGFTSYINRGHESGITTDYNSTFKNPVRMQAIEKGSIITAKALTETAVADGFELPTANTNWTTESAVVTTQKIDDMTKDTAKTFVEKGNKRYIIESVKYDIDGTGTEYGEQAAIRVTADHSSKRTTAIYVLNDAKNDVITILGTTSVTDGVATFTPDAE